MFNFLGMECIKPRYLSKQDMTVPCGKCGFCLATKKSDWSIRLMYEARQHLHSAFVTLTYADCHLTWRGGKPQLVKSDLQKWFKRVRKAGYKIRYFAVGEYGSQTFRPHYHILLFGAVPEEVIRKSWDKGLVHVGKVTQASVSYCLKYIVNSKDVKLRKDRAPAFAVMSRKPGLGSNYLSPAMIAWHKSEKKNYCLIDGHKRHLPRFYKEKIFTPRELGWICKRSAKETFLQMVRWLRSPKMAKMRDPIAYRALQMKIAEVRVRHTTKQFLTI